MKNESLANAVMLMNEEKRAISNYKAYASTNVITSSKGLITTEQLKFNLVMMAGDRVRADIKKALLSKAGVYNILQAIGWGMRTHTGFIPSESAIRSGIIIAGHYEHSGSLTFKFNERKVAILVDYLITYSRKNPEVALTSRMQNTRLLKA